MLNKTDTKTLDKRNVKRTKMVVGLRVAQQRSHVGDLLVHTLDISSSGAKIGALREGMQPGSVLIVQRRHTRARCLVMWSRKVAPGEIQIGIKFLGRDSNFWGLDLDENCAGVWFSESER
jgi:PilZ domain-containing protein